MTQLTRTAVVLLAAGRSLRHPGQSKLCRPLNGQPLALHAAQTITSLAPAAMIAVYSEHTEELTAELSKTGFEVARNNDPAKGLSSSLSIGVQAARKHDIDAILVCLADMPFVSLSHLQALVAQLDIAAGITMVGSRESDTDIIMPPAIFGGEMIDRLLTLEGDRGARELLRHATSVEVAPKELTDFDDPKTFEEFGS